jgi:hypothetical protein
VSASRALPFISARIGNSGVAGRGGVLDDVVFVGADAGVERVVAVAVVVVVVG